jgi:5'-nucleotidase
MLILLTNDDGITAPGILAAYHALKTIGEVHVVAPETVQSAAGHGITLSKPLLTSKVYIDEGVIGTAVDGRPADCVKLAVSQILPRQPDLVVSGINSGANTGINVIYSGTVAAAIEAAFLGLPSIALSQFLKGDVPTDYARAAQWSLGVIKTLLDKGLSRGQVASVNFPALPPGQEPVATTFCRQCTRPWADTYDRRLDPRGRAYYWNSSVFTLGDTESDTDVAFLRDGHITVTPLQFDMTQHDLLTRWQGKVQAQ